MMALKARQPTGRVPWPLILIEGGEKAGKSWACAELSTSAKVGQTYWLDLGEGSADEYGAIPGARYLVLEHDGTWRSIMEQVTAVRDEAERVAKLGAPPVVLVLDSITAEWELHKDWAAFQARQRLAKKGKHLAADEEPKISMDLWNDANARHRKLMTILMTFPGIVVVAARGKDVAALDGAGRPIEGSKEYKVDGQKNLAFDATVWIRVSRDHPPLVVGARSVHAGVRPGVDKPRPAPGLTLEKVVFDILKCTPGESRVRDLVVPQAEEPSPVVDDKLRGAIFALWGELGYGGDDKRDERMQITRNLLKIPDLESTSDLSPEEGAELLRLLKAKREHERKKAAAEANGVVA